MANRTLRQADLFQELPGAADVWTDRLLAAFADASADFRVLPLAEEAVAACPTDIALLLMAATAAVLDERPERSLAFLNRFSKRGMAPAAHLLHALALLHQLHKRAAARTLLKRHGLIDRRAALSVFPPGFPCLPRFIQLFDGIIGSQLPAPIPRPVARARPPRPSRRRQDPRLLRAWLFPARPRSDAPAPSVAETASAPPPLPRVEVEIPFTMDIDRAALSSSASREPEQDGRWFSLRERLAHLGLAQGFDELLCLPHLTGFQPLWHQTETVRKVLKQFRGRVLLADEVGLGKTIEACMVLKEYALRSMAERTLVLTPASLVGQWQEELEREFGLAFATTYDPCVREDPHAFWGQDRIVASIATARRREHAECLVERKFDLVIVDGAHVARPIEPELEARRRAQQALPAPAVGDAGDNDLIELYNLLTLLKPGIFRTLKEFRADYMTPGKPRQPANSERLRELMRGAMVRNTRGVAALKLPRRNATTIKVDGAAGGRRPTQTSRPPRGGWRPRVGWGDSAWSCTICWARRGPPRPRPRAPWRGSRSETVRSGLGEARRALGRDRKGVKEAALIELVRRNPREKKLVFVHSRETLAHVADRLAETGVTFARFDGSLRGPEKDAAITEFRDHATILLCTQSGGEGRNIQFCNTLINFDVPWNPMAIEQRIGRIDRIGQDREVFVFNLVTRGTLEEQVLALLEEKISMFELVVGEVGAILGGLEEEREFPDLVLEAWLETTEAARAQAFDTLGRRLDDASRQHQGAKALDDKLFGEDFEAA